MFENYSGATKIIPIVGHPIAQAKSPSGMTNGFADRGADIVVVPFDVAPANVQAFLSALDGVENLAGVIATVPHKFALCAHAPSQSDRARFFGSANVMRRDGGGSWHADMLDGVGFVQAIRTGGGTIEGKRVLLGGAGGAGGAIAFEILKAGAASLAVYDIDAARQDRLIASLNSTFPGRSGKGVSSPAGFDIIVNASPLGMRESDPSPFKVGQLKQAMFVGDVVTAPSMTALIEAATRIGCATCSGHDMFNATRELQLDFFLNQSR